MKITIVGAGYVGLVTGAGFADSGNDVCFLDVNETRISALRGGGCPIEEPGLAELLLKNFSRLRFETDPSKALPTADVVFLCVPTPSLSDGSADLSYLRKALVPIVKYVPGEAVVVVKSTVPPGTTETLVMGALPGMAVAMNPEFLAEGRAVSDFQRPDRVVIGSRNSVAVRALTELYAPFVRSGKPVIVTDPTSAEISKLASNVMLATRISMMNEIANVCDDYGGDVEHVRKIVGADARIGAHFLYAGAGFGGSCFGKDLEDFVHVLKDRRGSSIANAVLERNRAQRAHIAGLAHGLAKKGIAVWGLAFKPETDDVRDSPALDVVRRIVSEREHTPISLHDPSDGARRSVTGSAIFGYEGVEVTNDHYGAIEGYEGRGGAADVLVLMTEWMLYRSPDWKRIATAGVKHVVDGRNIWDPGVVKAAGINYIGIGRR